MAQLKIKFSLVKSGFGGFVKREICGLVGERIRAIRKNKDLTIEELAFKSEVHPNYLGDLERGLRNPSLINMEKIARGLDVPIHALLKTEDPEHSRRKQVEQDSVNEKLVAYLSKISKSHSKPEIKLIVKLVKNISNYLKAPKNRG